MVVVVVFVECGFISFQHLVELRGYDFPLRDNAFPFLNHPDSCHYGLDQGFVVEVCGLLVLDYVGLQEPGDTCRPEGAVVGVSGKGVDHGIGVALGEVA